MGISVAAAVAVVCVITIAGGAVYLYPLISGPNKTTTITAPSTQLTSNATTFAVSYFNTSYITTTYSPGLTDTTTIMTSPTWQAWAVANATFGYPRTQAYVQNAWNFTFNIAETPHPNYEIFVFNYISILRLNVSGSWTSGYNLTFIPTSINVTVWYKPPSTYYPIRAFNAVNETLFRQTVQFNGTQQRAISIALADNSVKSSLSSFPYFVDDAFMFPASNKTYGGDYLVWFFQANGPKIVGVFVNVNLDSVVTTYSSSRAVKTCYSNGMCVSSPWGSP